MGSKLRLILSSSIICACMWVSGAVASTMVIGDTLQTDDYFVVAEDSLKKLAVSIIEPRLDAERIENGMNFKRYFLEVINHESSFDHPFDSLSTVSLLMAPDSSFRIVTWYIPLISRRFLYYGFLQFRDNVIELVDATDNIAAPAHEQLSAGRWLGTYYYDIISSDMGDYRMYTLLGWKGHNPDTRMRIIEPLLITEGAAVFGAQVFSVNEENDLHRIVFEYAARGSMNLVYEPHFVHGSDQRIPLIAFDRLSPLEERYAGQYAYYVPEANIVDAFVFSDGKWVFIPDIDARNPDRIPAGE